MNPIIKASWLSRLRAGDVRQGRYVLHSYDGCVCPLGVLADMAVEQGLLECSRTVPGREKTYNVVGSPVLYTVAIPFRALEWATLTLEQCAEITKMNDFEGRTLLQIADWIEENL